MATLKLLPKQQAVVDHIEENNLVVALPGSGKTFLLVRAVEAILVNNPNARPYVVTFTNAAAAEMSSRLKAHLSEIQFSRVTAKTFHSLMLDIFRLHFQMRKRLLIGADSFTVINRARFMIGYDQMNSETAYKTIEKYGRMLHPMEDKDDHLGWQLYRSYIDICERGNFIDLNTVSRIVVSKLVSGEIEFTSATHLLVDEFQDTDDIQMLFIEQQRHCTISAVGDDDQSIYSFRGGVGYKIMNRFRKNLNANQLDLDQCMRCKENILNTAFKLIEFNSQRIPKTFNAFNSGGKVEFLSYESADDEHEGSLEQFRKVGAADFAILTRTNRELDAFELKLQQNNIEYQRLSGTKLFDKLQMRFVLHSLLPLVVRQKDSLANSVFIVLSTLDASNETIAEVKKLVQNFNLLKAIEHFPQLPANDAVRSYFRLLESTASAINGMSLESFSGAYMAFIKAAIPGKKEGMASMETKCAGILLDLMQKETASLRDTIKKYVALLHKTKSKPEIDRSVVKLVTYHSSKGLEFEHVFAASVNNGTFPSEEGEADNDIREEERRVLYVGFTRAITTLSISSSSKISPFLLESYPDIYKGFKAQISIEDNF